MLKYGNKFQYNFQCQQQYSLQKIEKQQQLLKLSYEALKNLLSLAEKYAKYGTKDIKSEFVWKIYYFQKIMFSYIKKYKEYIFPADYPKERLLYEVHLYRSYIHIKDKYLYDAMIDLFNGKKLTIDFDILFDELDKDLKIKNSIVSFEPKCIGKNELIISGNKKYPEKYQRRISYEDYL